MRSIVLQSFAKWGLFFKDEMTTAAAIDCLVHHSEILELNTESFLVTAAKKKQENDIKTTVTST